MAQRQLDESGPGAIGKAGFEALLKVNGHAAGDEAHLIADRGQGRREEWLLNLDILYKQVEDALGPYVQTKQVSIEFRLLTLVEQLIGEYTARRMVVTFANTEIVLEPIGTMVLAARGRVDVIGPFGKTPLLLVANRARRLSDVSQWNVRLEGKLAISNEQLSEPNAWEWRVVSKSLDRELITLTEEVILGLFAEVANG